jgi:hypothetical protein
VLLPAYTVLVALLSVLGIREDLRFHAPAWKATVSALGNGLGVAGLVLYATDSLSPDLARIWGWVFGFLVLQLVVELSWDLRHKLGPLMAESEMNTRENRTALVASLVLGLATLLPLYVINFRIAFG